MLHTKISIVNAKMQNQIDYDINKRICVLFPTSLGSYRLTSNFIILSLPMFQKISDIFFDLDHTIWDFDKNAEETLIELYFKYQFDHLFNDPDPHHFITVYHKNNHRLWDLYHHGEIDKVTLRKARFAETFQELGVDSSLFPSTFEEEYLSICPTKTNLFPYAHETLSYLNQHYNLHLITNGFKEASVVKIEKSNLKKYFKNIVISELVGVNKPDPKIFEYAVKKAKTNKNKSVMIGDNVDADIRGAINFGMNALYFNPLNQAVPLDISHQIRCLSELKVLFRPKSGV